MDKPKHGERLSAEHWKDNFESRVERAKEARELVDLIGEIMDTDEYRAHQIGGERIGHAVRHGLKMFGRAALREAWLQKEEEWIVNTFLYEEEPGV